MITKISFIKIAAVFMISFFILAQFVNKEPIKKSVIVEEPKKIEKTKNKMDISDARNYVDNKIESAKNFPSIKHTYYTVIDVLAWQLETYPDLKKIGLHSEKIMLSTLCFVNNLSNDDYEHINNISQLMIYWQPSYVSAMNHINDYLSENHKHELPDKDKANEFCSVFDKYPADGFEFLYGEKK